jgi:3-isopropylmalate dehydrogenase
MHCCAQAQHGSAPDIAGQDKANPASMILSVAMLLQWLGEHHHWSIYVDAANALELAVDKVLENPHTRTADLGGTSGCKAFGEAVASVIDQN